MGKKRKSREHETCEHESSDIVIKLTAASFWKSIMILSAGMIFISAGVAFLDKENPPVVSQENLNQPAPVIQSTSGRTDSDASPKTAGLEYNLRYLQLNPWNVQAHLLVGNYYLEETRNQEALVHFRAAAEYEPDSARVLIPLGKTYRQMKEIDLAIEKFQAVLDAEPLNPEPLYYLGLIYGYDKNDTEKAVEFFKELLSKKPDESLRAAAQKELDKLEKADS